jgi:hypothetical protein
MTEHELKYDELAKKLGIEILKRLIPFSKKAIDGALAEGDVHLNKWGNRLWDTKEYNTRRIAFSKGIKSWSLCDNICLLKHVAKFYL